MGVRKRERATEIKEAKKALAFAKLNNCPTSPRKMRLVADLVRGVEVDKALAILKFNQKEAAARLEKLLRSAIANWQAKERGCEFGRSRLIHTRNPCGWRCNPQEITPCTTR